MLLTFEEGKFFLLFMGYGAYLECSALCESANRLETVDTGMLVVGLHGTDCLLWSVPS